MAESSFGETIGFGDARIVVVGVVCVPDCTFLFSSVGEDDERVDLTGVGSTGDFFCSATTGTCAIAVGSLFFVVSCSASAFVGFAFGTFCMNFFTMDGSATMLADMNSLSTSGT